MTFSIMVQIWASVIFLICRALLSKFELLNDAPCGFLSLQQFVVGNAGIVETSRSAVSVVKLDRP